MIYYNIINVMTNLHSIRLGLILDINQYRNIWHHLQYFHNIEYQIAVMAIFQLLFWKGNAHVAETAAETTRTGMWQLGEVTTG